MAGADAALYRGIPERAERRGKSAFGFRNRGEDDGTGIDRFHGRATLDRNLHGPGDLVFVPRLATSFDLTMTRPWCWHNLLRWANDTGPHARTEIYGVDAYWKWKPAHAHGGFPFVSWQTEALYQRFEAGATARAYAAAG